MAYFLGVDGGGTGCRARICDASGRALGSGGAGPANIASDLHGARKSILDATQAALDDAGLPGETMHSLYAFLGLAGANIDSAATELSKLLPFEKTQIDNDAAIALEGAIGSQDGAAAIIGTGSIFVQRKAGTFIPRGGWGLTVSDHASGARLGRSLLELSLLAHEQIRPHSALSQKTMAQFENDPQEIVTFVQSASPADFGRFAPEIFAFAKQNDAAATAIIGQAILDIEDILRIMELQADQPFCMLGGLGPKYVPYLSKDYREQVQPPLTNAVGGAASLAMRHFGTRAGNQNQ